MHTRVRICGVAVVSMLAAALVPVAARGEDGARAAAPAIRAAEVRSSYETADRVLSRDIGASVKLPDGHDLWLFGDTSVYALHSKNAWVQTGFIDGNTALEGKTVRGQVPRGGEYPSGKPARFIPDPNNVYLTDGSGRACLKGNGHAAFSARWPSGAAVMASNTSEVLVTYSEVCVTVPPSGNPAVRAEGWGYMLYNWRTRHIAVGPIDVFKPQRNGAALDGSHIFGWPVFIDGRLTMFSSSCTAQYLTCGGGHVWSVSTSTLSDPNSYNPKPMTIAGSATTWQPMSISVGQYPHELRMVETTTIGGDYKIFSTPTLGKPWRLVQSGVLPDCAPNSVGYCHGVESHPELSTPTAMFISYKDPSSGPGGHMVISAIPYP
jgi:hypothetical protein